MVTAINLQRYRYVTRVHLNLESLQGPDLNLRSPIIVDLMLLMR